MKSIEFLVQSMVFILVTARMNSVWDIHILRVI